jgi:hypothetical protein
MKKSCIIISAFLLFINSSLRQRAAQPTEQPKPLLTVGQAELLAMRLANDMFGETMSPDYRGGERISHEMPDGISTNFPSYKAFSTNNNPHISIPTRVETNFVNGHWIFNFYTRNPHYSCYATVELAPDVATNLVTVMQHGGLP